MAPLDEGVGQRLAGRRPRPGVLAGRDEHDPGGAALARAGRQVLPRRAALAVGRLHRERPAPPLPVDPDRDRHGAAADDAGLAHLPVPGVGGQVRGRPLQPPSGERRRAPVRPLAGGGGGGGAPARLPGGRLHPPRRDAPVPVASVTTVHPPAANEVRLRGVAFNPGSGRTALGPRHCARRLRARQVACGRFRVSARGRAVVAGRRCPTSPTPGGSPAATAARLRVVADRLDPFWRQRPGFPPPPRRRSRTTPTGRAGSCARRGRCRGPRWQTRPAPRRVGAPGRGSAAARAMTAAPRPPGSASRGRGCRGTGTDASRPGRSGATGAPGGPPRRARPGREPAAPAGGAGPGAPGRSDRAGAGGCRGRANSRPCAAAPARRGPRDDLARAGLDRGDVGRVVRPGSPPRRPSAEGSPALVRAAEGNGRAERFIRTPKENPLRGAEPCHRRGAPPGAARLPRGPRRDLADRAARLPAARRDRSGAALARGPWPRRPRAGVPPTVRGTAPATVAAGESLAVSMSADLTLDTGASVEVAARAGAASRHGTAGRRDDHLGGAGRPSGQTFRAEGAPA